MLVTCSNSSDVDNRITLELASLIHGQMGHWYCKHKILANSLVYPCENYRGSIKDPASLDTYSKIP